MPVSAMSIKLVLAIEALSTESALWVALEPALIDSTRIVVAELFMLSKFLLREEIVLVREYLFVASTQIAHYLVVHAPYMSMKIWPAHARHIHSSRRDNYIAAGEECPRRFLASHTKYPDFHPSERNRYPYSPRISSPYHP